MAAPASAPLIAAVWLVGDYWTVCDMWIMQITAVLSHETAATGLHVGLIYISFNQRVRVLLLLLEQNMWIYFKHVHIKQHVHC